MIDVARIRRCYHSDFDGVVTLVVQEAEAILTVYEQAIAWRTVECSDLPFCEHGTHEYDCAYSKQERLFVAAIDAARSQP